MILRTRYLIRWISAFLKRFKGILLLGIFLGIFIFLIVNFLIPYFLSKTSNNIGVVGMYKIDDLPDIVSQMISQGLTKVNDYGELEPAIASSWESPDQGKTWIFHINEQLKWQDGKNIVSEDISYDFNDVSIEKPDSTTIIFKLKDKFSPFPHAVSRPVYKRGLMGMGKWKVDKINLIKDYVEKIKMSNKNGRKLVYNFYPTEEKAKMAFKMGEIHYLYNIYNATPFYDWKTVNVIPKTNYNQIITLFFNTKNNSLSDKSLRQALNYSIDKDASTLKRAISPISPLSWAYNPQVKNYTYDLPKAKELISGLGKNGKPGVTINLYVTPTLLNIAEKISKDWDEIGIKTNIVVSSQIPSEYDAFLAILDTPNDPDQYSLWHSTQTGTNISKYQNQRNDKLLEDGRIELTLEERKKIYLDFQRFLIEDTPAIFLYHPTTFNIERK